MVRIMFVCHGNICRSPMAEFILRDMTEKLGRGDEFEIASSATSTEEIWNGVGNPVYPPAKEELLRHDLSCEGKRAVQLRIDDYDKYDLFICMDEGNLKSAVRILGGDRENKVKKLLSYAGSSRDVDDPWYSGDFETTYNDIYSGCKGLLELI